MVTAASRSVLIEKELPCPPQKVWRALTEPALIKEWLMDTDFQPIPGRKFTFRARPMPHWNGITDCQVLAVEPHKRLSYAWNSSGDEAATGLKTIVTWTLSPSQTGTLLRMEQSGFRLDQTVHLMAANYGWQNFLSALEKLLETSS